VCCGAAGGKRRAERVEVDDLASATHDPLLASLRQRLRSAHGAARTGRLGVRCVFSRESVSPPHLDADADTGAVCEPGVAAARGDGTLNCHGYGSTVTVTATFGLAAAGEVIAQLIG
jgi:tRNA A37 threonylcarbamoyladenosine dehydratase